MVDEGVPLHQRALVADLQEPVAVPLHTVGVGAKLLPPLVDAVDELLLGLDLPLEARRGRGESRPA